MTAPAADPAALGEEEREALAGLAEALTCSQCGQQFSERACGMAHAMIAAHPTEHRLVKPLIRAAEERARLAAVTDREAGLRMAVEGVLADLWRVTDCGCGHRADLHLQGHDSGCIGGLLLCPCRDSFSTIVTRRLRAALAAPEARP